MEIVTLKDILNTLNIGKAACWCRWCYEPKLPEYGFRLWALLGFGTPLIRWGFVSIPYNSGQSCYIVDKLIVRCSYWSGNIWFLGQLALKKRHGQHIWVLRSIYKRYMSYHDKLIKSLTLITLMASSVSDFVEWRSSSVCGERGDVW